MDQITGIQPERTLRTDVPNHTGDEGTLCPLSPAEQGIWSVCQRDPENPCYTGQGRIVVQGQLNEDALRAAWRMVLRRHKNLRAGFRRDPEGIPVKYFRRPPVDDADYIDLEHLPAEAQREIIENQARSWRETAYDLERDQLFQLQPYRRGRSHYEILISYHEIILDPASIPILLKDLTGSYELLSASSDKPDDVAFFPAMRSGAGHAGPQPPENMNVGRTFWAEQLSGDLPSLTLPLDRLRPAALDYRSAKERIVLDAQVTRAIRTLSRDEGVSLATLLLCGIELLLSRYSGQSDVTVGVPVDNRLEEEAESIGVFQNFLPLRARIPGDESFRSFLRTNEHSVRGAVSHVRFPFEEMVAAANAGRDLGVPSLFQVTFGMPDSAPNATVCNGVEFSYETVDTGYIKHELAFEAQDHGDRLGLEVAYLTQLFDAETIRRMLANFAALAGSIADNPDRAVKDLDYVAPAERDILIHRFNATAEDFGPRRSIHRLFEEQVQRTPCNPAVHFGNASLSYRELNRQANQLAHFLMRNGAGPGERIGVCLDRSLETLVGLLGIIKTGATYVPLDPQHPIARLEEIVRDCDPAILLTHGHRDGFKGYAGVKVHIDSDWDQIAREDPENPAEQCAGRSTLAIIYTSATTGKPKGVLIPESAVLNRLQWMWNAFPFTAGDVAVVQKSSALVASTWELFGGLLRGVPSVILSYQELLDPARLWRVCCDRGVTHFLATPALIEGVLLQAERRPDEWRTLRFATTSAEPVSTTMVRRWRNAFPDTPLFNLYGATECASNATVFDTRDLSEVDARVPVGKPLSNVQVYVLDNDLNLLPQGAVGELCVGGACLAEGYLDLPELDAERFVMNPFTGRDGDRLYRTGDLVRMRADRNLEFIGRRDNQVNVRGFRVELNDVEAVLETHASVKQAVVVLSDRPDGQAALYAFVVIGGDANPPRPADLRAYLEARLPAYMVPANFVVVDRMPLTRQGKVDRNALRGRCLDQTAERPYVAPTTKTEIRLAKIWEELLEVRPIGPDDDFFDLGGHSLLAVRLFAEIHRSFGKDLPLSTLYHARSLRRLADVVADGASDWSILTPITPRQDPDTPILFCVHGIFGEVLFYRDLAESLGPAKPLYALQPPTLGGEPVKAASIHELAATYVSAIRKIQPAGPYYLAGYSFGSRIALEIAQILRQEGERPALLVSFDGTVGEQIDLRLLHKENIGFIGRGSSSGRIQRLAQFARSSFFVWWCYMAAKAFAGRGLWLIFYGCSLLGRPLPRALRSTYTELVLHRIARHYRPASYDGRTIVFCTPLRRDCHAEGWRKITGPQCRFIDIEGRHDEVFEPENLRTITSVLNEELGECAERRLADERR